MKSDQDLYKQLRDLPKEQLWRSEVPRFDAASQRERMQTVALIRALGTIFSRFGTDEEKAAVRGWLIALLKDPQEKVRRYAMAALPKIGGDEGVEAQMLSLLKENGGEREKRHLGRALEKIGGSATLAFMAQGESLPELTQQKVQAAIARRENPGTVELDALLPGKSGMQINLRCRRGLEKILGEEAEAQLDPSIFRLGPVRPGCVTLTPLKPFSLAMLYEMRCFATVGIRIGLIENGTGSEWEDALAGCIASSTARKIMLAATNGAPRYRVDFPARGHQRGAIRNVVQQAHALAPELLNDARQAPWSVDVTPVGSGPRKQRDALVELRPRLYPDPRLGYRQDDISAASHPPLAACMARLAAQASPDSEEPRQVIWDPFCGSGLELIERSMLGGVSAVHGTDLDPAAIGIARANFEAAGLENVSGMFTRCDFRNAEELAGIAPGSITLVITNPPLGRRIRVKDMPGLIADLLLAATKALEPGGLLVFTNPLRDGPSSPSLKLEYRQTVDLGGFDCQLEMYSKLVARGDGKIRMPKQ
ncbi:MAG: methyltransferase [Chthoniobacterales bacterium]